MSSEAYVMMSDFEFMLSSNVSRQRYHKSNEFDTAKLWQPAKAGVPTGERLVYKSRSSVAKLRTYDYYPGEGNLVIASERLKNTFEDICGREELGMYPCEIVSGKAVLAAWTLYPTESLPLVDKSRSEIEWFISKAKSAEPFILNFKNIRFKLHCLGQHNFVRWQESSGYLVVSAKLKLAIEMLNPRGVKFIEDSRLNIVKMSHEWRR